MAAEAGEERREELAADGARHLRIWAWEAEVRGSEAGLEAGQVTQRVEGSGSKCTTGAGTDVPAAAAHTRVCLLLGH